MKRLIAVFITLIILLSLAACNDSDKSSEATLEDAAAQYDYLAENYAHYTGAFIEELPREELDIPIPGVDYSPEDIAEAFDDYYTQPDAATSTPIATHVVRNEGNSGYIAEHNTVTGPNVWVGLGGLITDYLDEQSESYISADLYVTISDPEIWIMVGDIVVEYIDSEITDYGVVPSADDLNTAIIEIISVFAEDESIAEEMSVFDEIITEYVKEQLGDIEVEAWDEYQANYFDEAWDDYRDEPTPENIPESAVETASIPTSQADEYGRIKAEFYPISYKALGRQFYRETLNEKQQLAYDIAVTAIQAGKFEVVCDFGITSDEMGIAMQAVEKDFPEFFYLAGFSSAMTNNEGNSVELCFGINNDIKTTGADSALSQVAAKVKPVVAAAARLSSDIDKVKYVVDYMVKNTDYPKLDGYGIAPSGKSIFDMQTLWTGIVLGETVCAGYAASFQYYMKLLGIPATTSTGNEHAWNLLQLDGDYYYMDVTWIDTGESYAWFNFNETILSGYTGDEAYRKLRHTPESISTALPKANGTKYGYENWFGPMEPPLTEAPTPYTPPVASVSVVINGHDVSSGLDVVSEDGVLYARGKTFAEAFSDPGAGKEQRWFSYRYDKSADEIYITDSMNGEQRFTLYLYSDIITRFENGEYAEQHTVSAKTQKFADEVYIPMLAFAEVISKAGFQVEIVIDGKTHQFGDPFATTPDEPSDVETPDDSWSDPGHGGIDDPDDDSANAPTDDTPQGWDIPEKWESDELIEDWQEGPTSLWETMTETEVVGSIAGTYVGYYSYTPNPIMVVFNEDNTTGYWEELDSGWPAHRFEFYVLFDTEHPMLENAYNGLITAECVEDGHDDNYEFVVVSPTVLYEPMNEAIFYRVN